MKGVKDGVFLWNYNVAVEWGNNEGAAVWRRISVSFDMWSLQSSAWDSVGQIL